MKTWLEVIGRESRWSQAGSIYLVETYPGGPQPRAGSDENSLWGRSGAVMFANAPFATNPNDGLAQLLYHFR